MVAGAVVFLIGLAGAKCVPVVAWALQAPPVSQQSQAFDDFTRRVQQYVKLHNAVQSSLPRLKTTQQRKTTVERQRALAQKIREARSNAMQGDIFSPEINEQFRHVISDLSGSPCAGNSGPPRERCSLRSDPARASARKRR